MGVAFVKPVNSVTSNEFCTLENVIPLINKICFSQGFIFLRKKKKKEKKEEREKKKERERESVECSK